MRFYGPNEPVSSDDKLFFALEYLFQNYVVSDVLKSRYTVFLALSVSAPSARKENSPQEFVLVVTNCFVTTHSLCVASVPVASVPVWRHAVPKINSSPVGARAL